MSNLLRKGITWSSPVFLFSGWLFSLNVTVYEDNDAALAVAFLLLPASLWAGVQVVMSDNAQTIRHPNFYVACYVVSGVAFLVGLFLRLAEG